MGIQTRALVATLVVKTVDDGAAAAAAAAAVANSERAPRGRPRVIPSHADVCAEECPAGRRRRSSCAFAETTARASFVPSNVAAAVVVATTTPASKVERQARRRWGGSARGARRQAPRNSFAFLWIGRRSGAGGCFDDRAATAASLGAFVVAAEPATSDNRIASGIISAGHCASFAPPPPPPQGESSLTLRPASARPQRKRVYGRPAQTQTCVGGG